MVVDSCYVFLGFCGFELNLGDVLYLFLGVPGLDC